MKYILLLALITMSRPDFAMAHDGSGHVEAAWYQDTLLLAILGGFIIMSAALGLMSYRFPQKRKVLGGIGIASLLIGSIGFQVNQVTTTPVPESIMASLSGLPVTVYRTEGCTCCTGFAQELEAAGAAVAIETITSPQMRDMKKARGIAHEQESCHTSIVDGYVVEGHVPFAAIAQLVEDRPAISGITLPGMPIGTPGMPGKQTETHTVMTLENEPFWQSS